MDELPEFAAEYTPAQKIRLLVFYLFAGGATVLLSEGWLFPAISLFAASAHCREVFGFPGLTVLFYGLFVGIPLFFALVASLTISRRGYRILRDGQSPPIDEKVLRPTRIVRGSKAKLTGYFQLLSPLPLLAFAAWGLLQANQLSAISPSSDRECVDIHSYMWSPPKVYQG